ncbi:hypothetical protein RvY_13864 [Ramazzottius varieornatus]|uniref:Cwf19-like C-terminal domain-containing protein n=1 Tax=Ramazzottius varieornatus TaxID=947166 RepID=A0A1D1VR51_RAMVA|nr:hypothetical protein RvY_13864 [Ramazzottius varieornatus]
MDDVVWQDKNDDSEPSSDERSKSDKKRKPKKEKHRKERREKKLCFKDAKTEEENVSSDVGPSVPPEVTSTPVAKPLFPSVSTNPSDEPIVTTVLALTPVETKRHEWMGSDESSFLFPSVSRQDLRKPSLHKRAEVKAAQAAETERVYKSRELNPLVRGDTEPRKDKSVADASLPVESASAAKFGDGGLSWLRKSYSRLAEQAKNQKRSMEDMAAERWGSLSYLEGLIRDAEEREGAAGSRDGRDDRQGRDRPRDRYERNWRDDSSRRRSRSRSRERYHRRGSGSERTDTSVEKPKFVKPGEAIPQRAQTFRKPLPSSHSPSRKAKVLPARKEEDNKSPSSVAGSCPGEIDCEERPEAQVFLSEAELNQLNARILRAELMGDTGMVSQLRAKIASASVAREGSSKDAVSSKPAKEWVLLQRAHAKGFHYPVASSSAMHAAGQAKKAKVASHDKDGERQRYFADDDKYSLIELVSMERMQSAQDQNAFFARMAGKVTEKVDDEYGMDEALMKKALNKESLDQMSLADRDKAIMEHRQMSSALSSCLYCMEGGKMAKNAIIAVGKKSLLVLPPYASLTEGHCLVCPIPHVSASTSLDEDVWEEMQSFRRALTNMFLQQDMDCVFMETVMNLKSHPHTRIECVPLDKDAGSTAPMYFKKAILESESEWANNVKLVDLSKKNIRQAIPKNFPYFAVDFGMQGGYAHIIEDERKFPSYFGREVIGGMIDASPSLWLKNMTPNFNEQMKAVTKFTEMWRSFDFTYVDEEPS